MPSAFGTGYFSPGSLELNIIIVRGLAWCAARLCWHFSERRRTRWSVADRIRTRAVDESRGKGRIQDIKYINDFQRDALWPEACLATESAYIIAVASARIRRGPTLRNAQRVNAVNIIVSAKTLDEDLSAEYLAYFFPLVTRRHSL